MDPAHSTDRFPHQTLYLFLHWSGEGGLPAQSSDWDRPKALYGPSKRPVPILHWAGNSGSWEPTVQLLCWLDLLKAPEKEPRNTGLALHWAGLGE